MKILDTKNKHIREVLMPGAVYEIHIGSRCRVKLDGKDIATELCVQDAITAIRYHHTNEFNKGEGDAAVS
jgi:hypothetical protein